MPENCTNDTHQLCSVDAGEGAIVGHTRSRYEHVSNHVVYLNFKFLKKESEQY